MKHEEYFVHGFEDEMEKMGVAFLAPLLGGIAAGAKALLAKIGIGAAAKAATGAVAKGAATSAATSAATNTASAAAPSFLKEVGKQALTGGAQQAGMSAVSGVTNRLSGKNRQDNPSTTPLGS